MSRTITLSFDVDKELLDALQMAVSEGEASSVPELVAEIMTGWRDARHEQPTEEESWVRRGVEESIADSHPGFSVDEAFTEARDRLSKPQSKAS